jgi:hypothetical protein
LLPLLSSSVQAGLEEDIALAWLTEFAAAD